MLYRNDGQGRFSDVSIEAGLRHKVQIERNAKGLGLALLDFDHDGRQDIFVANDSTRNFLYLGRAGGHFEERALISGVAFNAAGKAEAGMGVAAGDFDGDQELDLFLTHLDQETNTLYRGTGAGLFVDATEAAGLGRPSLPWVGFGTVLLDFDHDGDLDLFVTNGHIIDNIEQFDASRSHRQPAQLFENQGGKFREVSGLLNLGEPLVGRGAAAGDLDRDGDLDLVITQNNGPALVLFNQLDAERGAIAVRLEGRDSNPQGFGARLELEADSGPKQLRWLLSASSYLSQGPPEAHFGIGDAKKAKLLTVHWPSGQVDRHHDLEAGYLYTLTEGSEEIERTAFWRP